MGHALSWTKQCAEALEYLHKMTPKPLLHRDLKPENILLADKARKVKLCDFGTVAELKTIMTKKQGPITYMAPEVMQGGKYSMKCDVYSLGITFWEILSREKPFDEIIGSNAKMLKIIGGERPLIRNRGK
ncbi:hypothetical protein PSTG_18843 [Puccinia striiformis f. sp. tritici PST-78]|uniref:Protein kinase domain-containing protein n=1 Tax=Puccinia striiformis f. sp. tritici PST-78 TaxID=1165861 RepID=A0A0L0ULA4_9BASI|nr:hypothetical protein PSTG_18843 [Puccinia striiformis f. sp. tritici PST-78]